MSTATVEIPTHHLVKTFVSASRKMLIGGKWLEAANDRIGGKSTDGLRNAGV